MNGLAAPSPRADVGIREIDFGRPVDAAAFLDLLDHYARDPMGGGHSLDPAVRSRLVDSLSANRAFRGAIAWAGDEPVGLIDCFLGFSTFAARPLLNVHDLVVRAGQRGRGIGQGLLWPGPRPRRGARAAAS